jgi:hypothetical protein
MALLQHPVPGFKREKAVPLLLADFCFALYLSGVREAAIFIAHAILTDTGGSP